MQRLVQSEALIKESRYCSVPTAARVKATWLAAVFPLPHGMSFLPAAKNETDRRLERCEIKRRLTRKVRMQPSHCIIHPADGLYLTCCCLFVISCPRGQRWPSSRRGRSCVSTSTSSPPTLTTTTGEQINRGPSSLLLTRWDSTSSPTHTPYSSCASET